MKKYNEVVIVGAGGTGSALIPDVARLISHIPHSDRPRLTIVENDKVEERNCQRQNFINVDIGMNKGEVMVNRYSAAFGIPIYLIKDRLTSKNIHSQLNLTESKTLVVDCVDNLNTRFLLHSETSCPWISLGNTDKHGQLVFRGDRSIVDVFPASYTHDLLKAEKDREEAERNNCALNAVIKPQTLAINKTSANVALNYIYELMFEKSPEYDIVFFDRFNWSKKIAFGEDPFDLRKTISETDFSSILSNIKPEEVDLPS